MRVRLKAESEKHKGWLRPGETYSVLEILFSHSKTPEFRIYSPLENTPAMFEAAEFVIEDNTIPGNWRINLVGDSSFKLTPQPWAERGFWERYFDQDPEAIRIFNEQKKLIEQ